MYIYYKITLLFVQNFLFYCVVYTPGGASVSIHFLVFVDSSPIIGVKHVKQEKKTNFYCATLANNGILAILSDIGQILSKIFKYRQIRSDYKNRQKRAKYLI